MKSIRARLIGGYVLVVAITLMIALMIGRWLLDRNIVAGIDLLNRAEFQEIENRTGADARANSESALLSEVRQHAELDEPLYYFQVRRIGGKVLFRSPNMSKAIFDPNPGNEPNFTAEVARLGSVRVSQFVEGPYQIQIGASLENHNRLFRAYSKVALVLMGIALVLSLFFGYWLSGLALDPIRRIQQTATRITANNLSERIPLGEGGDEMADLTLLLNQMLERLEYSFGRLWRFAADASHELKTPLSLIRLQSEKLLLHGSLTTLQQEGLQQQMESVNRLTSVIDKLLFISKSEFGAVELNLRTQSTRDLISAFSEDALVLCEDASVRFEVRENPEIAANFDAVLLRQVLLNLLNNALNVVGPGGVVRLTSTRDNSHWKVALEDNGSGLPEDKLREVFEPFVRIEQDGACHNGSGTGLGLAICRSIMHRGVIHAQNCASGADRSKPAGLRVTVELPL